LKVADQREAETRFQNSGPAEADYEKNSGCPPLYSMRSDRLLRKSRRYRILTFEEKPEVKNLIKRNFNKGIGGHPCKFKNYTHRWTTLPLVPFANGFFQIFFLKQSDSRQTFASRANNQKPDENILTYFRYQLQFKLQCRSGQVLDILPTLRAYVNTVSLPAMPANHVCLPVSLCVYFAKVSELTEIGKLRFLPQRGTR
jgi:hypothetical protein